MLTLGRCAAILGRRVWGRNKAAGLLGR
jgi:hypothetical protein